MSCDDRPRVSHGPMGPIRGYTETRRFIMMNVMDYRIYVNRMHPPNAARMESFVLAPSPITLCGRCVVPYGQPSRRSLPYPSLGRAHGFSGLVRTLKRMLLLFFYDLASKDQIFDAPLSPHDCPASSSPGTTQQRSADLQPVTYVGSLLRYRYRPRYLAVLGERR
jgi:hypothetical protein